MSGALVLWRDGTSRPAQSSAAFVRLNSITSCCRQSWLSFARQPMRAASELPSLTNIERSAAKGRCAATLCDRFTLSTMRSLSSFSTLKVALPPRTKLSVKVLVVGSVDHVLDVDDGTGFALHRPDQE